MIFKEIDNIRDAGAICHYYQYSGMPHVGNLRFTIMEGPCNAFAAACDCWGKIMEKQAVVPSAFHHHSLLILPGRFHIKKYRVSVRS